MVMYKSDSIRRTGLVVILSILMCIIIVLGNTFEDKLKVSTLNQNNVGNLIRHEALDGDIAYKLPSEWITSSKVSGDKDFVYETEFISMDTTTKGGIEIYKNDKKTEDILLKNIEEIKSMGVKKYKVEDYEGKDINGKLLTYTLDYTSAKKNNVYEYYISNGDYNVRACFQVYSSKIQENTPVIFESIMSTFMIR